MRAMWVCPTCGRTFANRNQTHTCRDLRSLDDHFVGTAPAVRNTFNRVLDEVAAFGPVKVLPEQTRIALHVRMSFAAFTPRRRWLAGHLVLARRVDSPRLPTVQKYSPGNIVHAFRLDLPDDVDGEFVGWLAEAYGVGKQDRATTRQGLERAHPRA